MTEGENMLEIPESDETLKAREELFELLQHEVGRPRLIMRAVADLIDAKIADAVVFAADRRAVIEALMTPTPEMVLSGIGAMSRDDLEPTEDEFRAGFVAGPPYCI